MHPQKNAPQIDAMFLYKHRKNVHEKDATSNQISFDFNNWYTHALAQSPTFTQTMQLTGEQMAILQSQGNIKINAVAGSGKTTTLIEYARSRPPSARILYLAFNKVVKQEAAKKFAQHGLHNVQVETAHSLAFKHVVPGRGYKISPHGYKTNEIADILQLSSGSEKHAEFILASHINKFVSLFCNSTAQKVQTLDYLSTIADSKAKSFVQKHHEQLLYYTRLFLSRMDKAEIDIVHDFYLKKFQLSAPVLPYDYILFDEGQDASPAMLEVFLKQHACKVIVGDTHQQIYGWRHAVNSLEQVDFKSYLLSSSFRFGPDIARLAGEVLDLKAHYATHTKVLIEGKGTSEKLQTKAVLARTNLGLLLKAIEYVTESKKIKHIYFEGNINSYTYADDGASLYDVLHLHQGRKLQIRDKLIKGMKDMKELEDYISKTEDMQLGMMVEIVKEYGGRIPHILKSIKDKHVGDEERDKAQMIFTTVHRCKGMEYDAIQLANDFISQEKLEKLNDPKNRNKPHPGKLNEEINLLYVAVTRAKKSIHLPEEFLPEGFPDSPHIHVMRNAIAEKDATDASRNHQQSHEKEKAYDVEQVRSKHSDAYKPWTPELDDELTVLYCEGVHVKDLMKHFGRTRGGILARIKKLELPELYD